MPELGSLSPSKPAVSTPAGSVIHPLDEFYARRGMPVPPFQQIHPRDVPEPYRTLLVHPSDMTSTLEVFYKQTVGLKVLGREQHGLTYYREVVLYLEQKRKPVEFGVIKIHLDLFDASARNAILQERWPLGRLLRDETIRYSSRPKVFLKLVPDPLIAGVLHSPVTEPLYGRSNVLYAASEQPLAEVVEILPLALKGDHKKQSS